MGGAWASKPHLTEGWTGDDQVRWSQELVDIIDASLAQISWDNFRKTGATKKKDWTLCHGDFHPGNCIVQSSSSSGKTSHGSLILLDWEMVGFSTGPSECAQFLISHMAPAERRKCEMDLLRAYYEKLRTVVGEKRLDAEKYSFEDCKESYALGGAEKWIRLIVFLHCICPPKMVQFWHDQLLAFCQDHKITPDRIGMPPQAP